MIVVKALKYCLQKNKISMISNHDRGLKRTVFPLDICLQIAEGFTIRYQSKAKLGRVTSEYMADCPGAQRC